MAAMSVRLSGAMALNAFEPLNGHRFADLVMTTRRPSAHLAFLHSVDHPVAQNLRIWLRHSCWPPPSQQVESKSPRFGNPAPTQSKNRTL
jgi:hypothetical protein